MTLLAGRRAVITGGGSGLGAAVARRFAAEGATGVILDVRPAEAPQGWQSVEVDVTDDGALAAALTGAGSLDVVVAAAGVVPPWRGVAETDIEEWDHVFRVNVRGMVSTFKHALPLMREGGTIVAIGSLNSFRGDPNIAAYVASKHAVLGLVRSAALDAGKRGIRVNAVGPGPIATDALLARMKRREADFGIPVAQALAAVAAQTALGRIATAEEVASAVLFLASDLSSGITGQLLPVDCGIA